MPLPSRRIARKKTYREKYRVNRFLKNAVNRVLRHIKKFPNDIQNRKHLKKLMDLGDLAVLKA